MTSPTQAVAKPVTTKGRATRKALLKAAEEVFGETSYERAAVAEITRRAGVAQGTFYVYFPDKKSAYVELVHELNSSLRRAISEALDGVTDRLQMESQGLEAFFGFIREHGSLYKVMREAEFVDPELYRWHYATLGEGYREGIQQAIDAGQLDPSLDAEIAADILMGLAEFVGWKYVMSGSEELTDQGFDQIVGFIRRGIMYRGDSA